MKLFMMSYQEPGNKKKEDGEILVWGLLSS